MNLVKWLYARLKNKYHEDEEVLLRLNYFMANYRVVKNKVNNDYIDSICKKHFVDYDMEKCEEFTFGFTEQERDKFRTFAIDLINNLP